MSTNTVVERLMWWWQKCSRAAEWFTFLVLFTSGVSPEVTATGGQIKHSLQLDWHYTCSGFELSGQRLGSLEELRLAIWDRCTCTSNLVQCCCVATVDICRSHSNIYYFFHYIIHPSSHCCHPLSFHPSLSHPSLLSCLTDFFYYYYFINSLFFSPPVFNSCVLSRISPPPLPPSCFSHVCCLSLFSPSFSIFLSLPLLCWSLWLILKGSRESEWDLKEREELRSTQQGRPSLDWNAARKKKKLNNTRERRAFPSLSFSLSSTTPLLSFITPELFDISLLLSFSWGSDLRALNANS